MIDYSANCNCKYQKAFNSQNTPMLIIDVKTGHIDDANKAACDYYSYSKEELLSLNIADINVLAKEGIAKKMDQVKMRNKKHHRFKHKLANGEIRDVEVYSAPLKIENRDLLSSIILDVEEKMELEKNFMENKAHFDILFNNSPEAIAVVDSGFRVLIINDRFEEIFQYSLIEIENKDITKLLCDQTLYETSYNFRELVANGKFVSEEVKRRKKMETP